MRSTSALERAAAELHCAAAHAERRAAGNPLDPWTAMAGTIRLVAAGLDPMPPSSPIEATDLQQHVATALTALDTIPPSDAPSDFAFWRAHVLDLAANVDDLEKVAAARPDEGS
jgi:hypothetical protein